MKWPFVSRSRYERELQQLEKAYSTSSDELRKRLTSLIDRIVCIKFERREKLKEIGIRVFVSERESMFFSPFENEEYWWEIAQKITQSLKAEALLHTRENLNDPN